MNGTPVVFGVGVLKGPFLPKVHSVSSLLLTVPVSASVASSPLSVPSLQWVETYLSESNTLLLRKDA